MRASCALDLFERTDGLRFFRAQRRANLKRLLEIRLERECTIDRGPRLLLPSEMHQHHGARTPGFGKARIDLQRLLDQALALGKLPLLRMRHAETVQRFERARVRLQDPLIERGRLEKPAGLVQTLCVLQQGIGHGASGNRV